MTRLHLFLVAMALSLVIATTGFSMAIDGSPSTSQSLSGVSNAGTPVNMTQDAEEALERIGVAGSVALLASRGPDAFYRITDSARGTCYGIGRSSFSPVTRASRLGVVFCPSQFPSAERPVLNMSVSSEVLGQAPRFTRVEGFAADGVVSVSVTDSSGAIVSTVPITNNVFRLAHLPDRPMTGLLAFDGGGNIVYSAGA